MLYLITAITHKMSSLFGKSLQKATESKLQIQKKKDVFAFRNNHMCFRSVTEAGNFLSLTQNIPSIPTYCVELLDSSFPPRVI